MSTAGVRKGTWTNSDGLVIGYGTNKPAIEGALGKSYVGPGGIKTASVVFDWRNLNAASALNIPVTAGSRIVEVKIVVHTGFTSTGTNTITVGDGSDADGFITTTAADSSTMATAGAVIAADGVYVYDDSADGDTTAREFKLYSSADTIDLASAQTDWTAGVASLVVTYI